MPDLSIAKTHQPQSSRQSEAKPTANGRTPATAFLPGRGVSVRYGQLPPDEADVNAPQVRILVFLDTSAHCEVVRDSTRADPQVDRAEGAVVVATGAYLSHVARWPVGTRLLELMLEPRFVHETTTTPIRDLTTANLAILGERDVMIGQMVGTFAILFGADRRPTSIYVESIATVLATHLIFGLFGGNSAIDRRGGLPIDALQRVIAHIEENYAASYDLDRLAALAGFSRNHFARLFKKSLNQTPRAYFRACQVEHAIRLLQTTQRKVVDIAHGCGFCDETQMARWFWTLRRIVPRDVRKAARR